MKSNVNIRPIIPTDFPAALRIVDAKLGQGYLLKSELADYVADPNKSANVACVDSVVVGLTMVRECNQEELRKEGTPESDWFASYFADRTKVGLVKIIAIDPAWQKQGIGTALLKTITKNWIGKLDGMVSIGWTIGKSTPAAKVLTGLKMEPVQVFERFWEVSSVEKPFGCPVCGDPPCLCTATIYARKFD